MGRFAKQRLTAAEREDRRRRKLERQRLIRGEYVHREFLHGPYEHVGDRALDRLLSMLKTKTQILVAGEQRHAKQAEVKGHEAIWQVERPVRASDVMLGYIYRQPDLEASLTEFDFNGQVGAAFICERLQMIGNLREYLTDLRHKVALDAPVCFVVPLAHWEFVTDHVNLFTEGTLLYNLILAGWNCKDAVVKKTPRHVEVTLRRLDLPELTSTRIDDIAKFTPYKRLYNYCSSEVGEAN